MFQDFRAALGESNVIVIPLANHFVIFAWFHELADPVKKWFQARLVSASTPAQEN
jgi:hypothetical protein